MESAALLEVRSTVEHVGPTLKRLLLLQSTISSR